MRLRNASPRLHAGGCEHVFHLCTRGFRTAGLLVDNLCVSAQVYHGEKPLLRRILLTKPGWSLIFALIFFFTNSVFVIRNELFDTGANPDDVQDRSCTPPD